MKRLTAVLAIAAVTAAGCGSSKPHTAAPTATALESYIRQVEPIRLAVNRLLNGADPILTGFHDHRLSRKAASRRMDALERRFADYTVAITAISPSVPALNAIHTPYAHTYILEDAYLSALVSALAQGSFDHLPDTQAAQRAAIIEWRTELTVLARRLGATLPADLQQAGRGEIAPAPGGS